MAMAWRMNHPNFGKRTEEKKRIISSPSQISRGQAAGGIDQGEPHEMHHKPTPGEKIPARSHGLWSLLWMFKSERMIPKVSMEKSKIQSGQERKKGNPGLSYPKNEKPLAPFSKEGLKSPFEKGGFRGI
jgi:hypothetical protein